MQGPWKPIEFIALHIDPMSEKVCVCQSDNRWFEYVAQKDNI